MHLECPHCQAHYDINNHVSNAVFICHRCGLEFSPAQHVDNTPFECIKTELSPNPALQQQTQPEATAPTARSVHIWPWFILMLGLLSAVGFYFQQDAWLDNRWLRSNAINLGIPLQLRNKDWHIIPHSIKAEWIKRTDNSRALLIKGRVQNLLTSAMLPPTIEIMFFSNVAPDTRIASKRLNITLPPDQQSILQSPYRTPAKDDTPVAGLAQREFIFLLESVPAVSGDFTLSSKIRQKKAN